MIIWLSSYPKSGNTWLRSLLAAYLFSEDGKFNFQQLNSIDQFSSKNLSSHIPKDYDQQTMISKNWIPAQKIINKDKKVHFLKTHNALCTINGNKFTDKFNTLAVIYIVRDPRNVITSLVNHYEFSIRDGYNFLTNKKKIIFPVDFLKEQKDNNKDYDFNFLSDWSGHYKSWKNINFCPIKIIRYEDLLANTEKEFLSVIDFLSKFVNLKIDKEKINNALNYTSFSKLSYMEQTQGFHEAITSSKTRKKIKFFNLGKKNNWSKLLDSKTSKEIKSIFRDEMIELGYL